MPPPSGIPTNKLETNLQQWKSSKSNKVPAVLIAPGSICPVHKMHIEMLEEAKKYVDAMEMPLFEVVAGYLSPSHDKYVKNKLKDEAISFEHRVELINRTLEDSNWITTSKWEGLQKDFSYWNQVLVAHKSVFSKICPTIQIFFVCGADLAYKSGGLSTGVCGYPVIILGRPEYTTQLIKITGKKNSYCHIITKELEPISSTEIRRRIRNGGNLEELMAPKAVEYLKQNIYLEIDKEKVDKKEGDIE